VEIFFSNVKIISHSKKEVFRADLSYYFLQRFLVQRIQLIKTLKKQKIFKKTVKIGKRFYDLRHFPSITWWMCRISEKWQQV